ncbi:unnamed protein product [Rangifer tarandus platyrhynchus]|uniref:Uncharacterized protein n=1 Tax=Rangifer tarandus platyrhynchus TaxID=3082113 RepID=A0ACB1ML34_RANTA
MRGDGRSLLADQGPFSPSCSPRRARQAASCLSHRLLEPHLSGPRRPISQKRAGSTGCISTKAGGAATHAIYKAVITASQNPQLETPSHPQEGVLRGLREASLTAVVSLGWTSARRGHT